MHPNLTAKELLHLRTVVTLKTYLYGFLPKMEFDCFYFQVVPPEVDIPAKPSLASTLMNDGMKAVGNTVSKLTRSFSTMSTEQVCPTHDYSVRKTLDF